MCGDWSVRPIVLCHEKHDIYSMRELPNFGNFHVLTDVTRSQCTYYLHTVWACDLVLTNPTDRKGMSLGQLLYADLLKNVV